MKRLVFILVLLLPGCHRDPAVARNRELSKLSAERTALMEVIAKDKKMLRRVEIEHTLARRKRNGLLAQRVRGAMYQLRNRIGETTERLAEVEQRIAEGAK